MPKNMAGIISSSEATLFRVGLLSLGLPLPFLNFNDISFRIAGVIVIINKWDFTK
jgi:hypothetical protein